MNKTTKIIGGIIIVIIIILLVIFYKPGPKETIKIGAILPLTGKVGNIGEDMRQAIDLAVEEINQRGDVSVEVIYEDEKCDPKEAVSGYRNLISTHGIKAIIGAGCSSSTLAIAPLAERDKIILITTSSAAPAVSDMGDYIFRNHGIADLEYRMLAKEFSRMYKTAALLYDVTNDVFVAGEEAFVDEWRKEDGEVKIVVPFQGGSSDYKTELVKIKGIQADINVILLMGVTKDQIILIKQLQELDIQKPILSDKSVNSSDFIEALGGLADGVVFVDADFGSHMDLQFWQTYSNRFNEEPNIFAAQSYDTLKILVDIISKKCSYNNTECIKNELYKLKDYQGAAGTTTFNEKGDAQKPLILKTIKNGQFVPLESF